MLRIKELNLTCMINDSERITEKLGHWQSIPGNTTDTLITRLLDR